MFAEIVKMARGQVQTVAADVVALTEGLSDYGVECATVELADVQNDGLFVEILNEVRLRDQLLVLRARLDDPALIRARYTVEQCFAKFGGRTLLVAA